VIAIDKERHGAINPEVTHEHRSNA